MIQRFNRKQHLLVFLFQVTACCCLFLAGKVEETPKKCKDIITVARKHLSEEKFASFGVDPRVSCLSRLVDDLDVLYFLLFCFKEEVMVLERILLQTIKFDLQVEHPYGFLIKYAKCLKGQYV